MLRLMSTNQRVLLESNLPDRKTSSAMDRIHNAEDLQCKGITMQRISNGEVSQWRGSTIESIHNGQHPSWTASTMRRESLATDLPV